MYHKEVRIFSRNRGKSLGSVLCGVGYTNKFGLPGERTHGTEVALIEDAVLFGGTEWCLSSSTGCSDCARDRRSENNGNARQFAPAPLFGLGNGGDYECSSRGDVCDHVRNS